MLRKMHRQPHVQLPRQRHNPSRSTHAFLLALLSVLSSCGGANQKVEIPPEKAKPLKASEVPDAESEEAKPATESSPALPWAQVTFSPRPGSAADPLLERAVRACGKEDAALHDVAQWIAETHRDEGDVPSLDLANFHLRRRGAPYVMPRVWSATIQEIDEEQLERSVEKWSKIRPALGEHRCGIGLASAENGSNTVSVVQVDVLADLMPLPTKVDSGEWLKMKAFLLQPTSSATVLLLPPEGRPRRIETKVDGNAVEARFSIETSGTWLVQLMATQSGGPRPVAQFSVTADDPLPSSPMADSVPGEDAWEETKDQLAADDSLFELMNAAREDQGLPPLERSSALDRLARAHSQAMMEQGRISHDTGAGDPAQRVRSARLRVEATGENVALAGSIVRLHRALWASPAHRENLLIRRWNEAGVGIAKKENGTLYATQLFVDSD